MHNFIDDFIKLIPIITMLLGVFFYFINSKLRNIKFEILKEVDNQIEEKISSLGSKIENIDTDINQKIERNIELLENKKLNKTYFEEFKQDIKDKFDKIEKTDKEILKEVKEISIYVAKSQK